MAPILFLFCFPVTLFGQNFLGDTYPALISLSENVKVNPYVQVGIQWAGSNLNIPVEREAFPLLPLEIDSLDVRLQSAGFWSGTAGLTVMFQEQYSFFGVAGGGGGFLKGPFTTAGNVPVNGGALGSDPVHSTYQFENRELVRPNGHRSGSCTVRVVLGPFQL
jgi:hypothetical protein